MKQLFKPHNYVIAIITTEKGYDPPDVEYQLHIESFSGPLRMLGEGCDIELIKECVENNIEELPLPQEGYTHLLLRDLKEDGERRYEIMEFFVDGIVDNR